jgi:hypothetical protein
MTSPAKFTFPHETLMPIIGKLTTNTTLQLLQRQLFWSVQRVAVAFMATLPWS